MELRLHYGPGLPQTVAATVPVRIASIIRRTPSAYRHLKEGGPVRAMTILARRFLKLQALLP